jgi:cell division protein FtsB
MSRSIKKKRRTWLVGFLLFLTLLLLLSTDNRGFIRQIRVNQEKKRLENEIESLQKEIAELEEKTENLKTPEYTEKIAREKYGMAKKDEKVYRVVPEEKK